MICFAFFTGGCSAYIYGPIWPDLTRLLEETPDTMKYGFMVRFASSAFGALSLNIILRYMNRTALLVTAQVVNLACTASIAFSTSYFMFLSINFVMGFFGAFGQTIMTVWTLELWSETTKLSAATQTLQLAYASSSLIAPLIARPYLKPTNESDTSNDLYGNSTTEDPRNVFYDRNEYKDIRIPLIIISGLLSISALALASTIRKQVKEEDEPKEDIEMKRRRASSVLAVVKAPPISTNKPSVNYKLDGVSPWTRNIVLALILLACFFITGYDTVTSNYLFTFLIRTHLKIPKSTAALINTAYGAASCVGLLIGIPINMRIKPEITVFFNLGCMIASSLTFCLFLNSSEAALWIAAVLYGYGISTAFANIIAILSKFVEFTDVIGSAVVLAGVAGAASFPPIIGGVIETKPIAMPILTILASMFCLIFMGLALVFVSLKTRVKDAVSFVL